MQPVRQYIAVGQLGRKSENIFGIGIRKNSFAKLKLKRSTDNRLLVRQRCIQRGGFVNSLNSEDKSIRSVQSPRIRRRHLDIQMTDISGTWGTAEGFGIRVKTQPSG